MSAPQSPPGGSSLDPAAARRALIVDDDILPSLIRQMDQTTLATSMRVNTSFNKLAGTLLYRTIAFDYSKPFAESAGAGVLDRNVKRLAASSVVSARYTKLWHMATYVEEVEVINHPGVLLEEWDERIARLRKLCPRLEVLRFKGHAADLRFAYTAALVDFGLAKWRPSVLEFIATSAKPVARPPVHQFTFRNYVHRESHIHLDTSQPADKVDQALREYISIFGLSPEKNPAAQDEDYRLYIDFVQGFGGLKTSRKQITKLAETFFWVRTSVEVTGFYPQVTEKNMERAERAAGIFREAVEGSEWFNEALHRERLEGCSFSVAPTTELGQYACLRPDAIQVIPPSFRDMAKMREMVEEALAEC